MQQPAGHLTILVGFYHQLRLAFQLLSHEVPFRLVFNKRFILRFVSSYLWFYYNFVQVCRDLHDAVPPLDHERGERLLSPMVMCGPHGLRFNHPVELRLPHCASMTPDGWSFALKSSDAGQTTAQQVLFFSKLIRQLTIFKNRQKLINLSRNGKICNWVIKLAKILYQC